LLIMSYPVSAKAKNCFSRRYVNESKSPIKSPFRTIGKLKVTKGPETKNIQMAIANTLKFLWSISIIILLSIIMFSFVGGCNIYYNRSLHNYHLAYPQFAHYPVSSFVYSQKYPNNLTVGDCQTGSVAAWATSLSEEHSTTALYPSIRILFFAINVSKSSRLILILKFLPVL